MTCNRWQVTRDRWHMTGDMWQVTCDMWHMTHSVGWKFSQNFSSLALTDWELWCFENMEEKDDWLSQSANHGGVFKTDPMLFKNPQEIIKHFQELSKNTFFCAAWFSKARDVRIHPGAVLRLWDQSRFWLRQREVVTGCYQRVSDAGSCLYRFMVCVLAWWHRHRQYSICMCMLQASFFFYFNNLT